MNRLISKTITVKIFTSDRLTNILYNATFIIAMFVKSDVTLEILALVKIASRDFNCSMSFFF